MIRQLCLLPLALFYCKVPEAWGFVRFIPSISSPSSSSISISSSSHHHLVARLSSTSSSDDSCPYSATFPTYRLDLTKPPLAPKKSLFSLPKSWLQSKCTDWKQNQDGLEALATLWRCVVAIHENNQKTDDDKSADEIVMGFPDAQPIVLHQFVQMYNWHQEYDPCNVIAEYELMEGVLPVVKLTKRSTSNSSRSTASSSTSAKLKHATVTRHTQAWVQRLLVERRICPFTRTVKASGQGLQSLQISAAPIDYRTSMATNGATLLADSLDALHHFVQAGPSQISSVLMAAPHYDTSENPISCGGWEYWSGPYFALLQASIVVSDTADQVGVVCFHPHYVTPDGTTWPGFGQMHSVPRLLQWCNTNDQDETNVDTAKARYEQKQKLENSEEQGAASQDDGEQKQQKPQRDWTQAAAGGAWQRRTPHATLNVLWADQLAAAESKRDSATLYPTNIAILVDDIGIDQLQQDLERERNLE